jgi:hypothetical protein
MSFPHTLFSDFARNNFNIFTAFYISFTPQYLSKIIILNLTMACTNRNTFSINKWNAVVPRRILSWFYLGAMFLHLHNKSEVYSPSVLFIRDDNGNLKTVHKKLLLATTLTQRSGVWHVTGGTLSG